MTIEANELQVEVLPPQLTLDEMEPEQRDEVLELVIAGLEAHYGRGFSTLHVQTWVEDLLKAKLTEAQVIAAVQQIQRTPVAPGTPFPVPREFIAIARPPFRAPKPIAPVTDEQKAAARLVIEKFHAQQRSRNPQP